MHGFLKLQEEGGRRKPAWIGLWHWIAALNPCSGRLHNDADGWVWTSGVPCEILQGIQFGVSGINSRITTVKKKKTYSGDPWTCILTFRSFFSPISLHSRSWHTWVPLPLNSTRVRPFWGSKQQQVFEEGNVSGTAGISFCLSALRFYQSSFYPSRAFFFFVPHFKNWDLPSSVAFGLVLQVVVSSADRNSGREE